MNIGLRPHNKQNFFYTAGGYQINVFGTIWYLKATDSFSKVQFCRERYALLILHYHYKDMF